jgi:eukaryotic-like serine/threonine-protein kinase
VFAAAKTLILSISKRPPGVPEAAPETQSSRACWGNFEITGELGRGSFGTVYRAKDSELQREVALKLFASDSGHLDEARKLAHIPPHRNIVTVFSCGVHDGVPGIVMEMVDGETLASVVARGRLAARVAANHLIQVCQAVETLHAEGIIHRDIKAQNAMRASDGRILVMDLGLAEFRSAAGPEYLAGTLPYMAPELLRKQRASEQSDIYALGVLLFHLRTGSFPVIAHGVEGYLAEHERGVDVAAACRQGGLGRPLTRIVVRALDPNPKLRYPSVRSLRTDLERWANRARRRIRIGIGAATVAILGVGTVLLPSQPIPQVPLVEATSYDGYTTDPSVSADGNWLAFASDLSGRGDTDIYVRPTAGGELRRVTDDPALDLAPSLSPDGKYVAYRSDRNGGGIYVRAVSGGPERLLGPNGDNPRYSRDGNFLVYDRSDEGNLTRPNGTIYVVNTNGGQPARVFSQFPDARYPSWTEDGEILFQGCPPGCTNPQVESDWWVGSMDGRRLWRSHAFDRLARQNLDLYFASGFLRNGFVYFGARQLNSTNIWRMPLHPGFLGLGHRAEQVTSSTEENSMPSVAPDGTLYFEAANARINLWFARFSDSGSPSVRQITSFPEIDSFPSISADGRRLLYFRRQGNSRWMVLREGEHERVREIPFASRGFISANGRRIVYSRPSGESRDMEMLDDFGGAPRTVCRGCGEVLDVPGDGSYILESEGKRGEVYAVDTASGKKAVILADPDRSIDQATVSSDGHWIVFLAITDQDHSQVFVTAVGAGLHAIGPWIAITDSNRWNDRPRWTTDGTAIVYISNRDDFECIWKQPVNRIGKRPVGSPEHLVPLHKIANTVRELTRNALNVTVSADGVLFNTAIDSGNIWSTKIPR